MERVNLTGRAQSGADDCPSIDDFRNQVYSTAYSVIAVFSLGGNGFALAMLIRTYRKNFPFYVYMLNLATADLLCVITLPMRVLYYANKGHWNQGDLLCRVSSYALYVNLYCSIFFMAAMSVTRFLAIVFPMQSFQRVAERRARPVCVAIWLFVGLSSSPFLMSGQYLDPVTNKTKCLEPKRGNNLGKLVMMNYLSLIVGFALPFLVIILCYVGIIRTLLSRTPRHGRSEDTKAICMIVIILLTFLFCFTPYHIQRTVHLSVLSRDDAPCSERILMQKSVVVTLCLAAANSCFDPILYFFSGGVFRRHLRQRTSSALLMVRLGPRQEHRLASRSPNNVNGND